MMEYQSHVESTVIHTRAICSYIWPLFLHMQSLSLHYFPVLFPMFTGEPSSFHLNLLLFQICPYETTINFPHEMDLSIMFHHVSIICFSLLSLLFTIVPHFSTWKSSSLLMFSYVFHHFPIIFPSFSTVFHPVVTRDSALLRTWRTSMTPRRRSSACWARWSAMRPSCRRRLDGDMVNH